MFCVGVGFVVWELLVCFSIVMGRCGLCCELAAMECGKYVI